MAVEDNTHLREEWRLEEDQARGPEARKWCRYSEKAEDGNQRVSKVEPAALDRE